MSRASPASRQGWGRRSPAPARLPSRSRPRRTGRAYVRAAAVAADLVVEVAVVAAAAGEAYFRFTITSILPLVPVRPKANHEVMLTISEAPIAVQKPSI